MNPKPTFFSTGNFDTRDELRVQITHMRKNLSLDWTAIAKQVGVSARTAKRCFEELEAIRREARAEAYRVAEACAPMIHHAEQEVNALPTATKIYVLLMIALLVLAAVVAFTHG